MTQLAAGLIGVILGAVVSEALRVWRDSRTMKRSARGRLRLLRNEMAMTMAYLGQEDITADHVRAGIARGIIRDDQWNAGQAVLSETLTQEQWVEVSAAYLSLQMLVAEPEDEDEAILKMARLIVAQMEETGETMWQHEETPEALRERASGR